jgi:hypothetical protein
MIITIDTEVLNKHGITANDYVYLIKGIENPKNFKNLHRSSARKVLVERQFLEIQDGYVVVTEAGFKLAQKDMQPIETKLEVSLDNLDKLAKEFRDLFPKGVRSGGYLVRGSESSCKTKLKRFKKKYPEFDDKTIIKATKQYVMSKQREGYNHMKLAPYFIEKDGVSMLAAECEALLDNSSVEQDDWGKDV